MSGYSASCPSCGASLVFSLGSSLLRVCEHCGVAVTRKGANLETYGKVAELIPTTSVLELGAEGDYEGAPPFTLVGRLQIDHGSGTWDEWLMAFRNETWAWLSESQGKFHYMGRARLPPVPRFEDLRPGETVDLGTPGVFVVSEARSGKFVTAQGELPFDVEPGSDLHYVDLSGPGGSFGTLDYGAGSEAEALYVGHEVSLAQLGFEHLPTEEERRGKALAGALSCPQCGGPLEVRAPDETKRIACPCCGSLLDATKDLAVLQALSSVPIEPLIPLGSKGRLSGVDWTLIGFMERSATVEGHSLPVAGVPAARAQPGLPLAGRGERPLVLRRDRRTPATCRAAWASAACSYRGMTLQALPDRRARRSTTCSASSTGRWPAATPRRRRTSSPAAPALARRATVEELIWSFASYQSPDEVWKAFGLAGRPPRPSGVAPNQPWPHEQQSRSVCSRALLFLVIACLLFLVFLLARGSTVHEQVLRDPACGAVSGSPESAVFAGAVRREPRRGNLQIQGRGDPSTTRGCIWTAP